MRKWIILSATLMVGIGVGLYAQAPAPAPAPVQQVPGYITAKPDAVVRAFGQGVASKIFSDAYTNVREQAILRSQKSVPGFQCPADPQIALPLIIPYPVKPGAVSWIER